MHRTVSIASLLLGMAFIYVGLTATASNEPLELSEPSPSPKTVLTDKEAGYNQADYDECIDRADLSDEAQCEE